MKDIALELLLLAALLLCSGLGGYAWRGDIDKAEIAAAEASVRVSASAATGNQAVRDQLVAQLDDLRKRHDAALAAATAALDARDAQIASLQTTLQTRLSTLRKTSHEDVDCAALRDLGVCAAVAGQLWPAAAQSAADGHPR